MKVQISIIIPYYKRGEVFDRCLASVLQQRHGSFEVIVVDNHSEDDVAARIRERSSTVRIIHLATNLGACAARNEGILAARGEILVFMDDDMEFASDSALMSIDHLFDSWPGIAVLAFQVCDPASGEPRIREWCHTRPCAEFRHEEFETNWFCEGASAVKREVFDQCGLYYEPFFYGAEGHDLIVRLLDHGFRILHTPGIRVKHWASDIGRTMTRQYYYFTRNYIWMAYKDYALWDGIVFLTPKLMMMFYFACRSRVYRPFFGGLWDGLKGLRRIRSDRTPISKQTVHYLNDLEKWRLGILTRLARHRVAPQI